MSILKSLIEGAIETYGEEGHLKITSFLSNYGVADGELMNFKRAWTAVHLGNKAFGSSSKVSAKADKFALDVIDELKSIDDDTEILERYINDYYSTADGCNKDNASSGGGGKGKAAADKDSVQLRRAYDFHNGILSLSSQALTAGAVSGLNPATNYLLPTKSTMIHKHMFRNAKIKWAQTRAHGNTSRGATSAAEMTSPTAASTAGLGAGVVDSGYFALCASAHGGVLAQIQGEVEFARDAGAHHAAAAAAETEHGQSQGVDSGEKFISSGHVVGYRLPARQHVFHAKYWETFHFLTEMLLLPSPVATHTGSGLDANAGGGVGGRGSVEEDSYIGSKFQLLPYPVSMLKDSSGHMILTVEDPKGMASASSSGMVPVKSLLSPAFTAHLRNHPSIMLHWCAQFQVLLSRLQHANYKCGYLQIGSPVGSEGLSVNDNQYAYSSQLLNYLYVKPNGNLVLSDVAYVYQAHRKTGQQATAGADGVDVNPSILTVRSLLKDFLVNALSLSRRYSVPLGDRLDLARAAQAAKMETADDSDEADGEGGDEFEDERGGDVSIITLLQGCEASLQFQNKQLCNSNLNDIILLQPADIFAFRQGARGLAADSGAGRTVVVQQQVHSTPTESITGGQIDTRAENLAVADVYLSSGGESSQVLNIAAKTTGVITLYVGTSTTPYNILAQQVQSSKPIQWTKCMAVRVIVLPKMNSYIPSTNASVVPTAVTINTTHSNNYNFLELIELIAVLENEYHSECDIGRASFVHSQAIRNYFSHIKSYDEVKFNKLWKQILDSINKKRR